MSFDVQKFKSLRGGLGLSQAGLAKASGVPKATIAAIEYGKSKNPSYSTVVMLAKALGVNPNDLFFDRAG